MHLHTTNDGNFALRTLGIAAYWPNGTLCVMGWQYTPDTPDRIPQPAFIVTDNRNDALAEVRRLVKHTGDYAHAEFASMTLGPAVEVARMLTTELAKAESRLRDEFGC